MSTPLPGIPTAAAGNSLAADAHSLDSLRALANQDPAKAVRQVATQFEALFMQMVLKSMRDATPKSGMFDTPEEQTYTSMLDEQIAQKIAAGGTGLGEVIARQLSANLPSYAPSGASEGQAGTLTPPSAAAPAVEAAPLLQTIKAARAARSK